MFRPLRAVCLALLVLAICSRSARAADTLDYAVVDPELTLERLDTSPRESFL